MLPKELINSNLMDLINNNQLYQSLNFHIRVSFAACFCFVFHEKGARKGRKDI